MQVQNGVPAGELVASWQRAPSATQAGRVSRSPSCRMTGSRCATPATRQAPALIYPRADVARFLVAVKNGEFDDL